MRTIEYISPTALFDWRGNKEFFYRKRLADVRLPREPQTRPMAVGSAFDAYIKADLGGLDFEKLFSSQVEEQNRDFGLVAGKRCLDEYKSCGAYADLKLILHDAQFELSIRSDVSAVVPHDPLQPDGPRVPLLGKPDAYFKTASGRYVVLDWKVNGYCSSAYPSAGYVIERPSGRAHKEAMVSIVDGVPVNLFGQLKEEWRAQTAIYSWLMGAPVGSEIIACIDQLVWRGGEMKVAEHRNYIDAGYQQKLYAELVEMWEIVQSGWIFRDMDQESSWQRQEQMDNACNDPALMACL